MMKQHSVGWARFSGSWFELTSFLGLLVLSLAGVSFFRLDAGPGEDIVARVLI